MRTGAEAPRPLLRDWLPSYLTLALIWGSSFAFMALALASFTPAGVALGRTSLGAASLLMLMALSEARLPTFRRHLRPLFIAAALLSIPWMIFAFGQTHISSALAGIISSATPIVAVVAMLVTFKEERPSRLRTVGLGVGLLGVLVVLGVWQGFGTSTLLGIVACLAAVIGYGVSFPYSRRHITGGPQAIEGSPLGLSAALLILGTLQLLPFAAVTGIVHGPITLSAGLAILGLGVLGSGIAYVLNLRVISRADATTASTVTYLTPLVAMSWGLVLGESISWNQPLGAVIILIGAAMAQGLIRMPSGRA